MDGTGTESGDGRDACLQPIAARRLCACHRLPVEMKIHNTWSRLNNFDMVIRN